MAFDTNLTCDELEKIAGVCLCDRRTLAKFLRGEALSLLVRRRLAAGFETLGLTASPPTPPQVGEAD